MQVFVGAKRTARWLGLKERGLSPQEKMARRREVIKPGFAAFKEWAETQHKNVLTKGAIGRALHYAVNQLPLIDPIENKIISLVLGRKNFLFTN
jgi:hypothetical protein